MENTREVSIVDEVMDELTELIRPAALALKKSLALAEIDPDHAYIAGIRRESRQAAEFVLGCQGIGPVEKQAVLGKIRLVVEDAPARLPLPQAASDLSEITLHFPGTRGGS